MERISHSVPMMLTFFMGVLFLSLSGLWCSHNQSISILCSYSPSTVAVTLSVAILIAVNMSLILTGTLRNITFSQVST
jgi:hypothetical protein